VGRTTLVGNLTIPEAASGLVVFAHGSGSNRGCQQNCYVSDALNNLGMATLQIDLLTPEEVEIDRESFVLRFDLPLLAERMVRVIDWACFEPTTRYLKLGLFGTSNDAGAALMVAAMRPKRIDAIVSLGGRVDLVEGILSEVQAPTLLIAGGLDRLALALNQRALKQLRSRAEIKIVPHASQLFEEPGALQEVADCTGQWFQQYLGVPFGAITQ
jgi:pimeloyl-ACP methyl ester carboxylesterase